MTRALILGIIFLLISLPFTLNTPVEGSDIGDSTEDLQPNLVIPGADYPQQDGGSDDRLFQYRSMWLEGYQIINHSEVVKVIEVARASNINCVTPLINAHYLGTFYNSSFHPRYRDLAWDFDPTMDLIREAHKYNIKVMPWFHTMIDSYAIRDHPDWGQVYSSGSRSGSWLNPTLPEVQQYLADVVYQLFRDYPLDGIHMDACRYPSSSYGYDDYSIQQYLAEGWTDFNAFRRQQMTEVMTSIYDSISTIRPYVWIGADIGASLGTRQNSWFQDTERWADLGIIDFVTPMIYTLNSGSLENTLRDNINRHSCPVVCGNYVYVPEDPNYGTVPDEATGIAVLLNQTERAINAGALGTCYFAYKFIADHPAYHRALIEGVFSEKALCPLKKQTRSVRTLEWEFELDQDTEGWRTTKMGNHYPYEGVWPVINVQEPTFMSPLLNISSSDLNVIEISMKAETTSGNISIEWSYDKTSFDQINSMTVPLVDTGDWNLYSIHIDRSPSWNGTVKYVRIVPEFDQKTNLTIDLIRITWMPDCIKEWAYLGPFFTGDGEGLLDRPFIDNESTVMPVVGEVSGGREWSRYFMDRDQVDLRFVLGHVKDAVTYSHVYIVSDIEGIVELRHGNSDGARIWMNQEEIFRIDTIRRAYPDLNTTYVMMRKGINTLMIKQVVYDDDNSFFVRFTGPGNTTLEGLRFYDRLPVLDPPLNIRTDNEWSPSSEVIVRWEPPVEDQGLDHYEWSIDGTSYQKVFDNRLVISGLSDGLFKLRIRCVDQLGFYGEIGSTLLKIDSEVPLISEPIPEKEITLVPTIYWDWEVLFEPISSIAEYLVTVENWRHGSTEIHYSVIDLKVQETHFLLSENIKDGYRYRINVKAVSGSGLIYARSSVKEVLVDLTPPLKPYGMDLIQTSPGSRQYWLSWMESVDNTFGGIEYYEVWWNLDWTTWELFTTTDDLNITIERPLGKTLAVKVRAKDISSHYSDFNRMIDVENKAPLPQIEIYSGLVEGAPLKFKAADLIDPDGDIMEYRWTINDHPFSDMKELTITLPEGSYDLGLKVVDDQGIIGSTSINIQITKDDSPVHNGSITGWLTDTSEKDLIKPDVQIEHWNNETVLVERNDTGDTIVKIKEGLMDTLVILVVVPLAILLILSILFLSLYEFTGILSQQEFVIEEIKVESKTQDRQKILQEFMLDQTINEAIEYRRPQDNHQKIGSRVDPPLPPALSDSEQYISSIPEKSNEPFEIETEVAWDEDYVEEWEEIDI